VARCNGARVAVASSSARALTAAVGGAPPPHRQLPTAPPQPPYQWGGLSPARARLLRLRCIMLPLRTGPGEWAGPVARRRPRLRGGCAGGGRGSRQPTDRRCIVSAGCVPIAWRRGPARRLGQNGQDPQHSARLADTRPGDRSEGRRAWLCERRLCAAESALGTLTWRGCPAPGGRALLSFDGAALRNGRRPTCRLTVGWPTAAPPGSPEASDHLSCQQSRR